MIPLIDAPIATLLAGIFAGMLVMLSGAVSVRRIATKTSLGQGSDDLLFRLIRAQGNFVEFAPMGLIAIFLVEIDSGGHGLVWTLAALLLAGRLIHAASMTAGFLLGRSAGMILTYASLGTAAYHLISRAF